MTGTVSTMGRVLERPATATLANGDEVTINDYVYFAPSWSERDGFPYSVARIIEFLPPTAAKYNHLTIKGANNERHVRLALFYRPSEISGRVAADHRLLLAAIHSEVHPVSWLRGKCWVRHREKIENLQEWKKKPDHFHFSRLFDPYIKREYEMLRTITVTNIPDYVRRVLAKRYEFLVTEKEMVADLTDTFRTCRTCLEWAPSQESVKCEMCKAFYHMDCVNPPLPTKPTRGYSWMCSQCMHDKGSRTDKGKSRAVDTPTVTPTTSLTLSRRSKAKEKIQPVDYDKPDAFFRGWNFRYFGLYTVAEHTIDSDDPIFPRQLTRLGTRYQAVVPTWEEQVEQEKRRAAEPETQDLPERALDRDIPGFGCMSSPNESQLELIKKMRTTRLAVPSNSIDAYDAALALLYKYKDTDRVMERLKTYELKDFGPTTLVDLNPEELEIFEAELMKWGFLETHETAKKVGREPWEILRYYYKWRGNLLIAENRAIRNELAEVKSDRQRQKLQLSYSLHEPPDVPVKVKKEEKTRAGTRESRYLPKNHRAVTGLQTGVASVLGHQREATPETDVEGSVWEEEEMRDAKPACSACGIKKDDKWWKAPRSQGGLYQCNHCGSSYRKYGVSLPYRAHLERAVGDKRSSTPMDEPSSKRQKTTIALPSGKATTPPPPLPAPARMAPCAFCFKMDPKPMARCRNCTFAVHPGCYGLPKSDLSEPWLCDPCANEKSLEAALDISCVLCPTSLPMLRRPHSYRPRVMPDFDYLHAVKPTEGYKWTHVLCATFVPELQWSDGSRLKVTEGIMSLKHASFGECDVCGQIGNGVIIRCGDCPKKMHTVCGWLMGYRFAFEMLPISIAKNAKRDKHDMTVSTFRDVTGHLVPRVWCSGHDLAPTRKIFEINDIDTASGLSALQTYAASGGQVPREQSFGLLRKAKRLDERLTKRSHIGTTPLSGFRCTSCKSPYSPKWYPVYRPSREADGLERDMRIALPLLPDSCICHKCEYERRTVSMADLYRRPISTPM